MEILHTPIQGEKFGIRVPASAILERPKGTLGVAAWDRQYMNLAKIGLRTVLLSELCFSALMVLPTQLAVAQERCLPKNENGDYNFNAPGCIPYEWKVVPNPDRLISCHIYPKARYIGRDYYNFPVAKTFNQGELIRGSMFALDDQGRPWIQISTSVNQRPYMCWVRANSQFIRPVLK